MEEQLKLLDKLETELKITFECFDAEPDCPKCSEEDDFTFQYRTRICLGDVDEQFGHLVIRCSGCGYEFRMLTKDTQEAYTEREDELPEGPANEELGEDFFDRATAEVAIDLGLLPGRPSQPSQPGQPGQPGRPGRPGRTTVEEEPNTKSKLPERMKKLFLEDEDKDKEDK